MRRNWLVIYTCFLLVISLVWAESSQRKPLSNKQPLILELRPKTCLVCSIVLAKLEGRGSCLEREFEKTDSGITIHYFLGDSGKQADLDWTIERMKRVNSPLSYAPAEIGNPPLCPPCAMVSTMIKTGAKLWGSTSKNGYVVNIVYPDSLADANELVARESFENMRRQFEQSDNVLAVMTKLVSGGFYAGPRHFRHFSISAIYVPLSSNQKPKLRVKNGRKPTVLKRVFPAYSRLAYANKIEGKVVFEVLIDTNGQVINQKILRRTCFTHYLVRPDSASFKVWTDSSGFMDSDVLETLKQWVFKPMILNRRAVKSTYQDSIIFKII